VRERIKPVKSPFVRIGRLVLAETGRGAEQQGQQETWKRALHIRGCTFLNGSNGQIN
jgi:hypothetical protein